MSFLFSGGLFDVIPDRGDLQARYDANALSLSDGQTVSTFDDETGNGHGLNSSGGPTYVASGINGNPVVRFDGVDDLANTAWTELSQPNHIFIVYRMNTLPSGENHYVFDADSFDNQAFISSDQQNTNGWRMYAGEGLNSPSGIANTNPHIGGSLFNGVNSTMRIDGSQVASGSVGSRSMDGFTLGARADSGKYSSVDIGEVLVYPQDKSGVRSDVESYLSEKWGVALA